MSKGLQLKKFVLNRKGVIELFTSNEMGHAVRDAGEAVARATGHPDDYSVKAYDLDKCNVAIVRVQDGNYKAYYHELQSNDLLKAIGAAGLSTGARDGQGLTEGIKQTLEELL